MSSRALLAAQVNVLMQAALRPHPLLPADANVQEDTAAQLALEWLARPGGPQQHDGALIIYTSGTTGRPKGE